MASTLRKPGGVLKPRTVTSDYMKSLRESAVRRPAILI